MREEVILAARQIIQSDGLNGLSMRAIARAVHTSPANLYEYFLNKEEIIFAVYNETLGNLQAHLQQIQRTNVARDDLLALCMGYIAFTREEPNQVQLAMNILQDIEQLLPEAQKETVNFPVNPYSKMDKPTIVETGGIPSLHTSIADTYVNYLQSILALFIFAVDRCVQDEVFQLSTSLTVTELAHTLWAFVYGLSALELPSISSVSDQTIYMALDSFISGLSSVTISDK